MKLLRDYQGVALRLTNARLAHILEHPEMAGLVEAIEETLANPEYVVQSLSDDRARLYYRFCSAAPLEGKFLCVVVKTGANDPFVLTAYLTHKVKKGEVLWPAKL